MIVYGIGLPRCGGQTLAAALRTLGLYCVHSPGNHLSAYAYCCTEVFREPEILRRKRPGCLFILNTRDEDEWFDSCRSVYHKSANWNHPLWRYPLCDFMDYATEYISNRSYLDNCLTIDVTKTTGWEELCGFLSLPEPDADWPSVDAVKRARGPETEDHTPPRFGSLLGK